MSWKSSSLAAAAALLICAAAVETAAAQSPLFLVRMGPTHAWRTSNLPAQESEGRTAFGGGAGFRLGNGAVALQGELLIIPKSTKRDFNGGELRLNLEYIEFPILAFVSIPTGGKVQPFITAGPVVSLEMRCRSEFIAGNSKDQVGCDLSTESTFDRNKVDLSAAGSVGAMYSLGSGRKLGLEARYTHGFRNISDDDENPGSVVKNRAASIFVFYSFPLLGDDM